MTYTLEALIKTSQEIQVKINDRYVPMRGAKYRMQTFRDRLMECWGVLTGKLDTVRWPENQ